MQNPDNLIWIDLEMTGLDTDNDVIIEIATIVTDSQLNVLAEGPEIAVKQPDAMLAGMDDVPYTTHSTNLAKGDRLFIYTDGVTEATNLQNELYGENRLITVMKYAVDKTPRDVIDIVRTDIDEFVNEAPQFDDITMLEMSFVGK